MANPIQEYHDHVVRHKVIQAIVNYKGRSSDIVFKYCRASLRGSGIEVDREFVERYLVNATERGFLQYSELNGYRIL